MPHRLHDDLRATWPRPRFKRHRIRRGTRRPEPRPLIAAITALLDAGVYRRDLRSESRPNDVMLR